MEYSQIHHISEYPVLLFARTRTVVQLEKCGLATAVDRSKCLSSIILAPLNSNVKMSPPWRPHDWLEGRGPRLTVLGFQDDATGKILEASFFAGEITEGYFHLLRRLLSRCGYYRLILPKQK